MENLSEETKQDDCKFCNVSLLQSYYPLEETEDFAIACDGYALSEGHIRIMPKTHIPCVGAFDENLFNEFLVLDKKVKNFLKSNYGSIATFEHGVLGQTIFHAHVHYLPFVGTPVDVMPEGQNYYQKLNDLADLNILYKEQGGYLYFGIDNEMWTVDPKLAKPRFFRDRFASIIGRPECANWKETQKNPQIMQKIDKENKNVQKLWQLYNTSE